MSPGNCLKILSISIMLLFGVVCSRPRILDVYWAVDSDGERLSSSAADRGAVLYAYVITENAEGREIRITIQEYDLIGGDEDCLDTFMSVVSEHAFVEWVAGAGDTSILEGSLRKYYFGAKLDTRGAETVFSDFIEVEW
jgi:hypothetical protein